MTAHNLHSFGTNACLSSVLSAEIASDLQKAIDERGGATLALSGGTTPKPLFFSLSQQELDWSRVYITLVDERWVSDKHPESNARLIREHLLQNCAAKANFSPLKTEHSSPFDSKKDCSFSCPSGRGAGVLDHTNL